MRFSLLVNKCLHYVMIACKKYEIDESHGIGHAMKVVQFAQQILQSELFEKPNLIDQKNIIITSSLLHDTFDRKYVDTDIGLTAMDTFLQTECSDLLTDEEIEMSKTIMKTMSYSTVKKVGYPSLGEYQSAYHIVREADLLSAYDIDRCTIFTLAKNRMNENDASFESVFKETVDLLFSRMALYTESDLFIHEWSKKEAKRLYLDSLEQLVVWKNILYLT